MGRGDEIKRVEQALLVECGGRTRLRSEEKRTAREEEEKDSSARQALMRRLAGWLAEASSYRGVAQLAKRGGGRPPKPARPAPYWRPVWGQLAPSKVGATVHFHYYSGTSGRSYPAGYIF